MLDIRPNCELCDRDLPPASDQARICSYECTYCAECAETVLHNTCPTCGGNLVARPIRPRAALRDGLRLGLGHHPASTTRIHSRWSPEDIATFVRQISVIPPAKR